MIADRLAILFVVAFSLISALPAQGEEAKPAPATTTIPIWPSGKIPGHAAEGEENDLPSRGDNVRRITNVSEPNIAVYQAPDRSKSTPAVIICPGGGYGILAYNKEGTEIAAWLTTIGITGVVLKYRVPRRNKDTPHAAPLQDAQRGLRLLRQHAEEWGINPKAIGILGFSAGGHLSVMAGVSWGETTYPKQDAADYLSCRPDFLIPIYPAYLGDEKQAGPLSPLIQVSKETPPVFIAVTHDDALRGVNAALYYIELKKSGVLAELHIYTKGGHGYGMRPTTNPVHTWPQRCEEWLRALNFIPAK